MIRCTNEAVLLLIATFALLISISTSVMTALIEDRMSTIDARIGEIAFRLERTNEHLDHLEEHLDSMNRSIGVLEQNVVVIGLECDVSAPH